MEEYNLKKYLKGNKNKETRWDRIRKKHINSVNVTTENVKKFFRMNFVNEHELRILNGESKKRFYLNPALVMNMRHEMIRRNAKDMEHHIDPLKSIQMEKIKNHNNTVETKYLDHELKKFRKEISLSRSRMSEAQHDLENDSLIYKPLDNTKLISSFSHGHECVQDFYRNSQNASLMENRIFDNYKQPIDEDLNIIDDIQCNDNCLEANKLDSVQTDDRYVRFVQVTEIINYDDEEVISSRNSNQLNTLCENTEREPVSEVKLVPKEQIPFETVLELVGKPMQQLADKTVIKSEEKLQNTKENTNGEPESYQNPFIIIKLNVINQPQINNQSIEEKPIQIPPEQGSIISDLFTKCNLSDALRRRMLQKYFLRWIHFTTIEKISKENISCNQSRIQKIEAFLNKIRLEKKKPTVDVKKKTSELETPAVLARKYHHKLRIQQDIIELQKLKLERQERMITELKFSKINDDAKDAKALIKDELKNVIRNGCTNSRAKARCLQIVANVRDDDDDEYAKLQARGVPKFLIEMEQRANERNRKHKEAKDRREQLEKEKEEFRLATEEAKRLQDEEAKRKRIDELREKRRQERFLKIQKENERLKQIENNKKANAFYRHTLLSSLGMNCFKMLIKIKKRNERKCEVFRKQLIIKNTFHLWKLHVHNVWNHRKNKADIHFNHQLVKKSLLAWKKHLLIQHSKMLVAIDWSDMKLLERIIHIWIGYTKMQKILNEIKMRQAEAHYNWHLKWRVIDHWQRLQTIIKIEKETEERRQRWRMKIWELLPDYTPNRDH